MREFLKRTLQRLVKKGTRMPTGHLTTEENKRWSHSTRKSRIFNITHQSWIDFIKNFQSLLHIKTTMYVRYRANIKRKWLL